ncbi:helix-turn-helix transcriptional regulator, partial [Methylobacterium ajmalii]
PVTGGLSPAIRRRTAEVIEARLAEALSLDDLAEAAGLSPFHFAKMFKASFGVPPHRYVTERRIARAKDLLGKGLPGEDFSAAGRESLAEVALACGFASQSHFTRRFKQATGFTPAAWRGAA